MYLIGYPFLVLTIVSVLAPVLKVENKGEPKRAVFAGTLLSAHFATCIAVTIVFAIFFGDVVNARMNMYDQVRAQMLHNAVVIVHSGGGAYLSFTPKDLTRNGIAIATRMLLTLLISRDGSANSGKCFPAALFISFRGETAAFDGVLAPLAIRADGSARKLGPQ